MENPGNFEQYTVLANRDQLEKVGLYHNGWKVYRQRNPVENPTELQQRLMNNRVVRSFYTFDAACNQYHMLRSMGLVALKNWLS